MAAELPEMRVIMNGMYLDDEGNEIGEATRARKGSFIITIWFQYCFYTFYTKIVIIFTKTMSCCIL